MDFSVEILYSTEKEMQEMLQKILKASKTSVATEINHGALMKLNKDILSHYVEDLSNMLVKNIDLCKSAASKVDNLKTEQIASQTELIKTQQEQLNSVQETVKTEMKSWADVAKVNTDTNLAVPVKKLKEAVKTAVAEDDRTKRFMIFGLPETKEGCIIQEDLIDTVEAMFETTGIVPAPTITDAYRLGVKKEGTVRPIKVHLTCASHVRRILVAASKLRNCEGEFHSVYLSPDRTKEEQSAHTKLVKEMKELLAKDPSKYYFIRNGKINCVDKAAAAD